MIADKANTYYYDLPVVRSFPHSDQSIERQILRRFLYLNINFANDKQRGEKFA